MCHARPSCRVCAGLCSWTRPLVVVPHNASGCRLSFCNLFYSDTTEPQPSKQHGHKVVSARGVVVTFVFGGEMHAATGQMFTGE